MTAEVAPGAGLRTLEDPLAEALRIVDAANARGLLLRLMGGMAVRAHAPDWTHRTRRREVDLDFATRGKDRAAVFRLLEAEGYTPDRRHNAMFGGAQGYFVDVPRRRPVDVLVDKLEMCHRIEFAGRLERSSPTLPVADLLLSKLQVVKLNKKDLLDALILLAEHPLADDDGAADSRTGQGTISLPRILAHTSNDWGWWRTVTGNLDKLDAYLATDLVPEDLDVGNGQTARLDPREQVRALRAAIDAAPKSAKWKLRARVGEKMTWYQEPEEVGHDVAPDVRG
ncbi:MAG TPA: hypothetical protein VKR30_04945 [Candidatus Limnocylindrales bacterium]|nr:hypothetical protein [Candidatus Limnocylindrales bacterium]